VRIVVRLREVRLALGFFSFGFGIGMLLLGGIAER
jgi:hypothetical protein